MILCSIQENNPVPEFARDAIAGYRWALEVGLFNVGIFHQYLSVHNKEWYHGGRYYDVAITREWRWGREHLYYDGPHDGLSLGFLHINWSGEWCDKCYAAG